jgi:hypothetical protein
MMRKLLALPTRYGKPLNSDFTIHDDQAQPRGDPRCPVSKLLPANREA